MLERYVPIKKYLQEGCLHCPVCGCFYTHFEDSEKNPKEIAHGEQFSFALLFWSECGHRWKLLFDGHKGNIFVYAAISTNEYEPVDGLGFIGLKTDENDDD